MFDGHVASLSLSSGLAGDFISATGSEIIGHGRVLLRALASDNGPQTLRTQTPFRRITRIFRHRQRPGQLRAPAALRLPALKRRPALRAHLLHIVIIAWRALRMTANPSKNGAETVAV
jgi:hypothetical protein